MDLFAIPIPGQKQAGTSIYDIPVPGASASPTPAAPPAPYVGMGDVQAAGQPPAPPAPPQQTLRAATPADQAPPPTPSLLQKIGGSIGEIGGILAAALGGQGYGTVYDPNAGPVVKTPGGPMPEGQSTYTPPASAPIPQNSIPYKGIQFAGGVLPWVAAGLGAAAPGVTPESAGVGAEDLENLPVWQQTLGMLGRGAGMGAQASILQNVDPTSRQGLQNIGMGAGMEIGAGLIGKAAEGLPAIVSRPLGGALGGALGVAAGYPAMTAQEKQQFGRQLLTQGLTLGAIELVMTALGGPAAFSMPGDETAPAESTETQNLAPGEEQAPVAPETLEASVSDNIRTAIDGMEPAEKEALTAAVANGDADGALGMVAAKMETPANTGGAQEPNVKLISTLKAILSGDEQPPKISGAQPPNLDVISKLKAVSDGIYKPTLKQNNEAIAKIKAIMNKADMTPAPAAQGGEAQITPLAEQAPQTAAQAPAQAAPQGSQLKGLIGAVGGAAPKDLLSKALDLPTEMTPTETEPTMDENAQAQKLALAQNEQLKAQAEIDRRNEALAKNPNPPDTRDTIKGKTDSKAVTVAERIRKAYASTVDTKARIGQAMKSLENYIKQENPAVKLSDRDNVALVAYNLVGTDNTINRIISNALVDPDGNIIGKSLKDVLSSLQPGDIDDLEEYMKARHAPSWLEKGRQVYPESKGITPDEKGADVARAIEAKQLAQHPYFEQIGKDWDQWQQQFTQSWLGDTGYLNQKVLDSWKDQFPHYIHREVEQAPAERMGYSIGTRGRGSTRNTYSFIDAAVDDVNHIVNKVRQNGVYSAMLRTAQVYPEWAESGWYRIDKTDEAGLAQDQQAKLDNPETMMDEAAKPLPEDATDEDAKAIVAKHGNTVIARVNGKSIAMKVDDPEYLKAMRSLRPAYMGAFFENAAKVTGIFKALTVSDNPYFMLIKHPMYDIPAALITSKTLRWNNPVDYIRGPFDIVQAAVDVFKGQVLGKDNESYDTYRAVGGGRSLPGGGSDSSLARVREDIVPGEWYEKPLKAASHVLNKAVGFIKNIDSVMATAPRLAEFNRWRALDDTSAGRQRALYEANDVSVNYGKSGNIGKQADAVIPFLNVGIQGIDKIARTFKDDPVNAIGKAAVMITLPTIALWLKNHGNPEYQKLSQYIKDHYYCIPNPADGGKTFIKIVKPRGWGVLFSTAPEHILDAIANKSAKDLTDWGGAFAQYFMMADASSMDAAAWQAWANKSYEGSPIVSTKLSALSPGLQGDQNDTEYARAIGKMLNYPPKKIDYLVNSYLGVIGQSGNPLQTMKSDLTADPSKSNDIETNFYNLRTRLDQAVADYKQKGVKSKDYNPALDKAYDKLATQMDTLTKAEQAVAASPKIPQAQKDKITVALKARQQAIMQAAYTKAQAMMQ